MTKKNQTIVFKILLVAIAIYASLYLFQERFIFHPQPITKTNLDHIEKQFPDIERITLNTYDGVKINGWLLKDKVHDTPIPAIIYFGGNAEEVSWMLEKKESFKDRALILFNYRGYGESDGKPSEKHLFDDSLLIYDYLTTRGEINSNEIAVMGRSLGTGVAVFLASQRQVSRIILVSPFDSITAVAQRRIPFAPIGLLLKHKFESVERAPEIKIPLLAFIADDDTTVPPSHTLKLLDSWGGDHDVIVVTSADHNSILDRDELWKASEDFLRLTSSK
ncbi:MAG: hypothetical protein KAR06_10410 [Deltaproteobacteria bacterium]|nr:hypothetical protein [Deltaproteobacteria bacterium]